MQLFRPPYGDYDDAVVLNARENGYYPIQWDVDSLDWKDYGVDSILNTVLNHKALGNGSIILCHNGAKYTADVYVIQGVVLFVTLLYVLVNLVVDILYGFVDPRLQPGRNK